MLPLLMQMAQKTGYLIEMIWFVFSCFKKEHSAFNSFKRIQIVK